MNLRHFLQTLTSMVHKPPQRHNRRNHPVLKPQFRGLRIANETGPMFLLRDRRITVIADVENLSYSARNAGYKFSYAALASVFRNTAQSVGLHACFSREPDQYQWEQYFRQRHWTPYARDIQYIQTGHGCRKEANADALVAFHAGRLAGESDADILIATGDGGLAIDIANSIVSLWPDRIIFTLAFPGAASARLKASNSSAIAGNLLVGLDCLHPIIHQSFHE